jgi:hypothetical protein
MVQVLTKTDNKKRTNYSLAEALENSNNVRLPSMTEILQNLNQINSADNICSFVCDKVKEIIGQ